MKKLPKLLAFGGIVFLAVLIRLPLLSFVSYDMRDFLVPWMDYIEAHGSYRALGDRFTNYTPLYSYFMVIVQMFGWSKVVAIKSISIFFDFLAAFFIFLIVRIKYSSFWVPLVASASFLFAPTVILNSSFWGQCDVIYTSFLLGSLYFLLHNRPYPAMIFFGLSFSSKLPAIFFAPIIVIGLFEKRIPWRHVGLVPFVYLLTILPCLLLGRGLWDLLTIYVSQSGTYHYLNMNAANLYFFFGEHFYREGIIFGGLLSLVAMCIFIRFSIRANLDLHTGERWILLSLISVLILPQLLPKMHERYLFPADVFSIVFAFYFPRYAIIPFMISAASLISYQAFLLSRIFVPYPIAITLNLVALFQILLLLLLRERRVSSKPLLV